MERNFSIVLENFVHLESTKRKKKEKYTKCFRCVQSSTDFFLFFFFFFLINRRVLITSCIVLRIARQRAEKARRLIMNRVT